PVSPCPPCGAGCTDIHRVRGFAKLILPPSATIGNAQGVLGRGISQDDRLTGVGDHRLTLQAEPHLGTAKSSLSEDTVESFWGHDGLFRGVGGIDSPPADLRPGARNQTLRAPVQVMDGNYDRIGGVCPWWGSVVRRR